MTFDPSHLLSQLSAMDRGEGDFKLKCQGKEVKAHSFVLCMRSKYFDTALKTGVGNAKSKSEMDVEDCSLEVLSCAVNFMYGIPIPKDFVDTQGLLHQADLFMMEDLKTAAGSLIAKTLTLDTVQDIALLAETYREGTLQEICTDFIISHIKELEHEQLSELALAMPSIARRALHSVKDLKDEFEEEIAWVKGNCAEEILQLKEMQESENSDINEIGLKVLGINMHRNQFKKRANFPSGTGGEAEYKAYVIGTVMDKMLVRCREEFTGISDYSTSRIKVGDIGRIISHQLSGVQVKWQNGTTIKQMDCFTKLELLTNPTITSFLT